jgi:tRNA(Ser,Leu) C12 N-acetylase TAN1
MRSTTISSAFFILSGNEGYTLIRVGPNCFLQGHPNPIGRENMRDWNTVVTFREDDYDRAVKTISELGPVGKTPYFNVLVMRLDNIPAALEDLRQRVELDRMRYDFLGRLVPLTWVFNFESPHDFEEHAKQAVFSWRPEVAGRSFHVRMHRRGFKGRLSSMQEEQFLDYAVMQAMRDAGSKTEVSFDDPDLIIAVETVDQRGGISIWTREELRKYPFLHLD